mmetsp:Transcript_49007/g.115102  ORF Transcript_49007/g.115102 Transcript_49007/m.115102 type:complete len:356 (+) Transcript_49007:1851-2918(+)
MCRVERVGMHRTAGQDVGGPVRQRARAALPVLQQQARLAAMAGDAMLVAGVGRDLLGRVPGAVAVQAMQQEGIEHPHRVGADADRLEGVEVHQPHLDVLDAALAQRMQRPLAGADHALGADGAVELVLDLQQAGRELVVVAPRRAHADGFIGRVGPAQRLLQRGRIGLQAVVADGDAGLGIALVAQPAHAQRGGMRQIKGVARQALQAVLATGDEAVAQRRAGAEQVEQQPALAAEVADGAQVLVGARAGQRPVVVDARNRLHAPAVALAQAHAVNALGPADIAAAIAADRNGLVRRQTAGHGAYPQPLLAERVVDGLMDFGEFAQTVVDAGMHAGDQLQLRFAVVGRDVRMRQR